MRKEGPRIVLMLVTAVLVLDAYLKAPAIQYLAQTAKSFGAVLGAFALGVGATSLVLYHIDSISRKRETLFESVLLLASMAFMIVVGVLWTTKAPAYQFAFNYVLAPGGQTIFAILCFYIASAAYRSFRVRSVEATILLMSAVLVMIGNVPIGKIIWSQFPLISRWLLNVPNVAGMRGITICAALGTIATTVRVLLGLERGSIGGA